MPYKLLQHEFTFQEQKENSKFAVEERKSGEIHECFGVQKRRRRPQHWYLWIDVRRYLSAFYSSSDNDIELFITSFHLVERSVSRVQLDVRYARWTRRHNNVMETKLALHQGNERFSSQSIEVLFASNWFHWRRKRLRWAPFCAQHISCHCQIIPIVESISISAWAICHLRERVCSVK